MALRLEVLSPDRLATVAALAATDPASSPSPSQLQQAFDDERAQLWGVWEAEALLAYALLYRLPYESELQGITVAPGARRRGLARALLSRLIEQAQQWGSERLLLEVRESNIAARSLYAQIGFKLDGRRKAYYRIADERGRPRNEDALLMSLAL